MIQHALAHSVPNAPTLASRNKQVFGGYITADALEPF
jgi:hypothetical protein